MRVQTDPVNVMRVQLKKKFPLLGVNKQREIVRLVFEISKREKTIMADVIKSYQGHVRFPELKKALLKRRYPELDSQGWRVDLRLPQLDVNPENRMKTAKKFDFKPARIFVEQEALKTELVSRLGREFPQADMRGISTLKDFIKGKNFQIKDYNTRAKTLFVVKQRAGFIQNCPCSLGSVSCGYSVCNLGFGCPMECEYCFLQAYTNAPGITLPVNIEDFFAECVSRKRDLRLGTGEFTDSLVLDPLTGYSKHIVNFFRKHPRSIFEFKTKTDNIAGLLKNRSAPNIVVGWSLNPQNIVEQSEHFTAPLNRRLEAAKSCQEAGFRLAFHFDPIIHYDGWEDDYHQLVARLFAVIDPRRVAWMSLGCLRMTQGLKHVIENRFPHTAILDGEFIPGFDGKLRYSPRLRERVYKKMKAWIHSFYEKIPLYLCMEEHDILKACGISRSQPFG